MITSMQNEFVKYWTSLKEKKNRDLHQQYLIEGNHLVEEAIKANVAIKLIYYNKPYPILGIEQIEVSKEVFKKITNTEAPQGIAAICKIINEKKEDAKKIIVLDGVQDPGNAGTILRSAVAFNFDLIIFSVDSVDLYNDKFIRATQGYFYQIAMIKTEIKDYLKNSKILKIATVLDEDATLLPNIDFNDSFILIAGNEGRGIKEEISLLADYKVRIPHLKSVDSLNVSIALSICMYEATKKKFCQINK